MIFRYSTREDEFRDIKRMTGFLFPLICEPFFQVLAETGHLPAAVLNGPQWQVTERAKRADPDATTSSAGSANLVAR